jgi:N6-adenosine-specific RNA methylase IME4
MDDAYLDLDKESYEQLAGEAECTTLRIDTICVEVASQVRVKRNQTVIKRYAQAMRDKEKFPPVIVYSDGETNWLADGVHRLEAAKLAGKEQIEAEVRAGGRRKALLCAVEANDTHGVRTTNKDKWQVVTLLLADPEWVKWSDGDIARRCGVSDRFVGKVRKEVSPNGSEMRQFTRKGKTSRMKTSGIGPKGDGENHPSETSDRFNVILVGPAVEGVSIPVRELAAPDCFLWLLTKNEELPQALGRLKEWGFNYVSAVTWLKYVPKDGREAFAGTSLFIIGMRGNPQVNRAELHPCVSQKGVSRYADFSRLRGRVAKTCAGTRIDLFARTPCEGWVTRAFNQERSAWEEVTFPTAVNGPSA